MLGRVFIESQLPQRMDAAPGETFSICFQVGSERDMRWGLIPQGRTNARGRPVMEQLFNIRSETAFTKTAFDGLHRGILWVDGWYEWTGQTRRKTRWRMEGKSGQPLAFACLWDVWRSSTGREVDQFATLTCEPNADVREYHHRMPVLLDDPQKWLTADAEDAAPLLKTAPENTVKVSAAGAV